MSQFNQYWFFDCPEYDKYMYEAMVAQSSYRQNRTAALLWLLLRIRKLSSGSYIFRCSELLILRKFN
jgi:hypothetical protein